MVSISKTQTTCHSEKKKDWKGLVIMKISDRATPFFKTTPVFYQPLTFMEKTEPPYPFWENSKTQTPIAILSICYRCRY